MNVMSRTCRIVLAVLLLPVAAGCSKRATVWVTRMDHYEVGVEGATGLVAKTRNGALIATGVEDHGNKVIVDAEVGAGAPSQAAAQAALDAIAVSVALKGEVVEVGWDWTTEKPPAWKSEVGFSIQLPPTLNVELATRNGGIDVRRVDSDCALETRNGAILARTKGARITAQTRNGNLDITTTATAVSLGTNNGAVIVGLEADGDVGGSIASHNGGIQVRLADTVAAMLDCTTSLGRIHCDHNLDQAAVSKTSLKGSIRGGQDTLHISTANGSIRIQ